MWESGSIVVSELTQHDFGTLEVWGSRTREEQSPDILLGQLPLYFDDCRDERHAQYDLQMPRASKKTETKVTGSIVLSKAFHLVRGTYEIYFARAQITLHGAHIASHPHRHAVGSFAPFAILNCGPSRVQTRPWEGREPRWEVLCTVPTVYAGDLVVVDIWDSRGARPTFLGRTNFELGADFNDEELVELPLVNNEVRWGTVSLSLTFTDRTFAQAQGAQLALTLHNATDLMIGDSNGFSDPYVIVKLGSERTHHYRTKTKKKTLNPKWEETCLIPRISPGCEILFEVWDKDTLTTDDFLGQATLRIPALQNLHRLPLTLIPKDRRHPDFDIKGQLFVSLNFTPVIQQSS